MEYRTIIRITLLLIPFALAGCSKEKINCTDEETFCALVNEQNFDDSRTIINNYLSTLTYDYDFNDKEKSQVNLEKLKSWLECKSCVGNVRIRCNSCIKTNPAQTELIVNFKTKNNSVKKIMDVSMGKPMRFSRYH